MISYRGPTRLRFHRPVDLLASVLGLILASPMILVAGLFAKASVGGESWLFRQERIGRYGRSFEIMKIRTMRSSSSETSVTTANDPRITKVGVFLRKLKIDELPQLWNVVTGEMAIVGPRPDVPGFADKLDGENSNLLDARPGITGAATLLFRNEETLLSLFDEPEDVNRSNVFPLKTAINNAWLKNGTLFDDAKIFVFTLCGCSVGRVLSMINRWQPDLISFEPYMCIYQTLERIEADKTASEFHGPILAKRVKSNDKSE